MNKKITLSLISLSLIALSTFAESRKIENLNFGWRVSYGDIDNASHRHLMTAVGRVSIFRMIFRFPSHG